MTRRKKIVLTVVITLAVALGASLALPVAYSPWKHVWIRVMVSRANQMRAELLRKTDFEALLAACRELSKRAADGALKPGRYFIRNGARDPQVLSFPQPILALAPSSLYIDENNTGRVMLEMFGGLDHFGVLAYAEDYEKPSWAKYGDKELIPGLWYYDDNYKRDRNYDKKVEALIQRGN